MSRFSNLCSFNEIELIFLSYDSARTASHRFFQGCYPIGHLAWTPKMGAYGKCDVLGLLGNARKLWAFVGDKKSDFRGSFLGETVYATSIFSDYSGAHGVLDCAIFADHLWQGGGTCGSGCFRFDLLDGCVSPFCF